MKKVIVIGCPRSGKSTFSVKLHEITHIPLFHLDMLYWNSDKTTVEKAVFIRRLSDAMENDEWIIDGNYASTMELRLEACDTVIFLDYPLETCLSGVRERMGKPRSDMPWTETKEDKEFIDFIKRFESEQKPLILKLLEKYSHKKIHIFKSRDEANYFLSHIKSTYV